MYRSYLFLLFFFPQVIFAQNTEVKIDRKQIQEPISPGDSAIIDNPFGDVRLRSGADTKVLEIFAVIQNLEPETPAPEILVKRKEKQVVLSVHSTQKKSNLDRADLVVYVPEGIKTSIKTIHGLIEVKGLTGDISAISERGEIIIRSVKGQVQAENKSGAILAELLSDVTSVPQNFQTRSGNITLYFWEGFNAAFQLETSGEITTDFSIQIDHRVSDEPDKIATGLIGQKKGQVFARSKQGKISILRLIKKLPHPTTN